MNTASKRMKYYISGPMTGYPEKNFPAFFEMEETMIDMGIDIKDIFNPARLETGLKPWSGYLKDDLTALMSCDVVVLLEGWPNSRGALLEVFNAYALDIEFYGTENDFIDREIIKKILDRNIDLILDGNSAKCAYKEYDLMGGPTDEWCEENGYFDEPNEEDEKSYKEEVKKYHEGFSYSVGEGDEWWNRWKEMGKPWVEDSEETTEKSILEEAEELTGGARQEQYGHPIVNFQNIADLWNKFINGKYESWIELTPEDVGFLMVLVKVAREMHTPKRDNLIDGAGYFNTIQMIRDHNKNTETFSDLY